MLLTAMDALHVSASSLQVLSVDGGHPEVCKIIRAESEAFRV